MSPIKKKSYLTYPKHQVNDVNRWGSGSWLGNQRVLCLLQYFCFSCFINKRETMLLKKRMSTVCEAFKGQPKLLMGTSSCYDFLVLETPPWIHSSDRIWACLDLAQKLLSEAFHLGPIHGPSLNVLVWRQQRQRSSIQWFSSQMPTTARIGSGWSQDSRTPPGSPTWVTESHALMK